MYYTKNPHATYKLIFDYFIYADKKKKVIYLDHLW